MYTRDGHFGINSNGILYDPSNGLAVDGYTANAQGVVNANGAPSTIQIPLGLKSQAVGTGFGTKTGPTGDTEFDTIFGGNLDSTLYLQANSGAATSVTISTTIYDSLGNSHLINITFTPVTSSVAGGQGADPTTVQVDNTAGLATSIGTEWSYSDHRRRSDRSADRCTRSGARGIDVRIHVLRSERSVHQHLVGRRRNQRTIHSR